MAFDKKAYNRWYYQRNKNKWKQYNDWRGSGGPVARSIANSTSEIVAKYLAENAGKKNMAGAVARNVAKATTNTNWDYVNKKRDAAYADASYKSNRRRTKTYSPTVSELAQYHRDADRRKMDIAKANYNRRNAESARSYAVGKSTLRSESKPKSGVIPRALRSYGSYYKIGVKSIGNSLSNAPKKVKNKLSNFYKKWLKW